MLQQPVTLLVASSTHDNHVPTLATQVQDPTNEGQPRVGRRHGPALFRVHTLARNERLAPHCCRWRHSVCLASSVPLGRLLPTSTARVNCLLPAAYCRLLHAAYLGTFRSSRCLVEAQPTWKARPTLVACPDLATCPYLAACHHLATPCYAPYLATPLTRRARPMPAGRGGGWHHGAPADGGAAVARRGARRQGVPRPLDTSTALYC